MVKERRKLSLSLSDGQFSLNGKCDLELKKEDESDTRNVNVYRFVKWLSISLSKLQVFGHMLHR